MVKSCRSLSIPKPRPVARSLRGIGLIRGSPRWPNLARHFPAGQAFVSDKTGLSSERRDPHDLLHRSMTTGAGNPTSSFRDVRHKLTRRTHALASIRHQSNGFPLREETFGTRSATPIRHYFTTAPSGCSRCSFRRTPGRLFRRILASVALRTSIGSRRRSSPFSSSRSKA